MTSMDRACAYAILSRELSDWHAKGFAMLSSIVGQTVPAKVVASGDEEISIEVRLRFLDDAKQSIRIDASALGPSCWRFERMDESVTVRAKEA